MDPVLDAGGAAAAGSPPAHKGHHRKNPRQLTAVALLRAQHAAGCAAGVFAALRAIPGSVHQRLALWRAAPAGKDGGGGGGFLFAFIRGLLGVSLCVLALEFVGQVAGWSDGNAGRSPSGGGAGILRAAYSSWLALRAGQAASATQVLVNVCVVLFVAQTADRVVLCLGYLWIKINDIKPRVNEDGAGEHPMVLVQVPMCNEKEVYEQSIAAVCKLDWPRERLRIQILDDSDDKVIAGLVEAEVAAWRERGVDVVYRRRLERTGYKAGNLKAGMSCDYVKDYEFVAIFDADFQPSPDFLRRTVPHLTADPAIGLVQARWSFVNKEENLLTRMQCINMSYHFELEQQVNGVFIGFFGFNGTAGVWRMAALQDSGGWMERTTVEDMDIAVRAHLNGWKFIFLNDVKVPCELPESYHAYRKQQHRWHSGPMNLFRLCFPSIISSKISVWKKVNLIVLFFLLRKVLLPFYCFTLFCVVLPAAAFVPEADLPAWLICHAPIAVSFLNVLPALRYLPYAIPYSLFENTMAVTKFKATVSGLLQLGSSYEWVVTKKAGRTTADPASSDHKGKAVCVEELTEGGKAAAAATDAVTDVPGVKKANKIYKNELALSLLLLTAAVRSLLSDRRLLFYVLVFQSIAFLLVGLDLVGEQLT